MSRSPLRNFGTPTPTLHENIAQAGSQTGIDPDFIHSVIWAESGYNAKAVSPKGAQGLMQLMPATAAKLGVLDSLDPANNIDGGSRYAGGSCCCDTTGTLSRRWLRTTPDPNRWRKYTEELRLYQETRSYVARVITDFNRRKLCPNKGKESVCQGSQLAASKPPVKDSKHPVSSVKDDPNHARLICTRTPDPKRHVPATPPAKHAMSGPSNAEVGGIDWGHHRAVLCQKPTPMKKKHAITSAIVLAVLAALV